MHLTATIYNFCLKILLQWRIWFWPKHNLHFFRAYYKFTALRKPNMVNDSCKASSQTLIFMLFMISLYGSCRHVSPYRLLLDYSLWQSIVNKKVYFQQKTGFLFGKGTNHNVLYYYSALTRTGLHFLEKFIKSTQTINPATREMTKAPVTPMYFEVGLSSGALISVRWYLVVFFL